MSIKNSIVHFVDKNLVTEEVSIRCREDVLSESAELEHLSGQIKKAHRTKAEKYFGYFEQQDDEVESPLSFSLQKVLDEETTFVDFSKTLADAYGEAIGKSMLATGGYLYLEQFSESGKEFLLVAILSQVKGVAANASLNLESVQYLDLGNVQSVALIDINEWQAYKGQPVDSIKPYMTAARGKGNGKVVEYFRQLIGFEESYNSTEETSTLVEAVDTFCEDQSLDAEQIKEYKKKAYSYCDDKAKSGEPVVLKELSYSLDADDPDGFIQFAMDNRFGLAEEIPTDRRELKKFVRFSGQGGGMSIAFSSDLLGKDVHYDPNTDKLTITKIPENLREQLASG